jgi:hypothetical protein
MGEDFQSCYEEHIQKYPTMIGIVQQFDEEHETILFSFNFCPLLTSN